MCGIFGTLSNRINTTDFINLAELSNQYRGPDSTNYFKSQEGNIDVVFGHTRLIITGDSIHGQQPIVKGKMVLVYNGEIFSFEGVHINGTSDTEVLADLLEGGLTDEKLNSLNGFFAFGAYYTDSNTFYLVRDRFGEKPLYYKCVDGALYFSSTARPFNTLDVGAVSSIKEAPGGGILFDEIQPAKGVSQVPPGHILCFKNGRAEIRKWYQPQQRNASRLKNYKQVVDEFEFLLFDAVRIRIRDQNTVAVSLSGGLDSTLVVDTIKRIGGVNIEAFTLSTDDPRFNELKVVEHHASRIGVNLNVVVEPPHDVSQFNRCLEVLEFPSYNFSFVGYDSYYEAVRRKGIRVIMEGHGPDEYLGGYAPMHLGYMAGRLLRGDLTALQQGIRAYQGTFGVARTRALISVLLMASRAIGQGAFPSGQMINHKFFDSLSIPIVLRTFDRISMLNHIETRSPFMDYRLVEFGRSLPDVMLFHQGRTKSILRTILESRGFKDTDFGPKIGFTANYDSILRDLCSQHGLRGANHEDVRTAAHKNSFDIAHAMSQKIFNKVENDFQI
jgi:asparagine synthase (glutamine-hydrolysing)